MLPTVEVHGCVPVAPALRRCQRLAVNDLVIARFVEVTNPRFLLVTALAVERPRALEAR